MINLNDNNKQFQFQHFSENKHTNNLAQAFTKTISSCLFIIIILFPTALQRERVVLERGLVENVRDG